MQTLTEFVSTQTKGISGADVPVFRELYLTPINDGGYAGWNLKANIDIQVIGIGLLAVGNVSANTPFLGSKGKTSVQTNLQIKTPNNTYIINIYSTGAQDSTSTLQQRFMITYF